ncbi:sarcinarray family MAST domain-containing protein [Methanosarcina sp.]|uniref:sarcinarray family MAST domain-containing protein n=1 Tax=Methanosarcina sp. TaxID=2213 RepID=UPI003C70BE8F
MKVKWICPLFIILLLIPSITLAESPYGSMDVYYNDKLLPGKETAKPTLKIEEPFKVKINLTVYQKSDVYVSLSCMEKDSFKIINGPTSRIEEYSKPDVLEANSSKEYEWIVEPTERWRGGSLPLDIYYTILAHGDSEPLVNSGFTVAYCTISNEYYEGEAPVSENQPTAGQPASENSSAPAASAPAFSLLTAIVGLAFVFFKFSRR